MKKLIYLLLFLPSLLIAQTTVRMSATATGTNTYSCLFNPNVATFNSSTVYVIPFTNANTSGTITLDPDGAGPGAAVSIKGDDGNDLSVGAIKAGGTYSFKFNGTLLRMIGTYTNSGGWAVTGTTNVTNPSINFEPGIIEFKGSATNDPYLGINSATKEIQMVANTTVFNVNGTLFEGVINGTGAVHFKSAGANGADLNMTTDIVASAFDDIDLTAGASSTNRDINLTATNGHVHLTTGAAGILLDPAGPITINTDPGASGEVLQSNGAGAAPTWVPVSGGAGKLDALSTYRRLVANHTLDATDLASINGDEDLIIEMNITSSANTVTIPLNATQAFPIGTAITLTQYGTGITSVVATGGVTIRSSSGVLTSPGQYSPMVLEKVGTDEWYLFNGLQASVASWQDWSSSLTTVGFSSFTVQKAWYKDDGNTVTMWVEISGTSNSGSFQFSAPVAMSSNYSTNGFMDLIHVTNNGTNSSGRLYCTGGATLITLDPSVTVSTWTASGVKGVKGVFTYQK